MIKPANASGRRQEHSWTMNGNGPIASQKRLRLASKFERVLALANRDSSQNKDQYNVIIRFDG